MKSYDAQTKQKLENVEIVRYKKKDYKFEELKTFLEKYARDDKKELVEKEETKEEKKPETKSKEDIKKERKAKKPYYELYDYRQFNTRILESEKAGIVFYTTS